MSHIEITATTFLPRDRNLAIDWLRRAIYQRVDEYAAPRMPGREAAQQWNAGYDTANDSWLQWSRGLLDVIERSINFDEPVVGIPDEAIIRVLIDSAAMLETYTSPSGRDGPNASTRGQALTVVSELRAIVDKLRPKPVDPTGEIAHKMQEVAGFRVPLALSDEDVAVHAITKLPESEDQSRIVPRHEPIAFSPEQPPETETVVDAPEHDMGKLLIETLARVAKLEKTSHALDEAMANQATAWDDFKQKFDDRLDELDDKIGNVDQQIPYNFAHEWRDMQSTVANLDISTDDLITKDNLREVLDDVFDLDDYLKKEDLADEVNELLDPGQTISDLVYRDDSVFDDVEELKRETSKRHGGLVSIEEHEEMATLLGELKRRFDKLVAVIADV